MSPVSTLTRPSSLRPTAHQTLWGCLAGTVGIVAVALVLSVVRGPDFVDRVTVDNRTNDPIQVDVRGSSTDGRLGLGVAGAETTTTFDTVIDEGASWTFDLSNGPHDLGRLHVSRAELAAAGWRLVIPQSVAQR